jgi:hypothetical protein
MGILWDIEDWIWGLSLIGLTIAIHATGVVVMGITALKVRILLDRSGFGLRHQVSALIILIGASGLLLATLHGFEAAIWAAAYLWVGAFDSPPDAMLYSIDSMTTRGASGLALPRRWQIIASRSSEPGSDARAAHIPVTSTNLCVDLCPKRRAVTSSSCG